MPAEWFEKHKLSLFGILIVAIIALQIAQLATGPSDPPAYSSTPEQYAALPRKVYVSGAVNNPGVYEFRQGDRVEQALELAGGAADGADLDRINLAIMLVGEQQVHVPEQGGVSGESSNLSDRSAYGSTSEQDSVLPRKIYVSGAVNIPGVYEFQPGDRVEQALELAGGAADSADLDRINLAVLLVDEQQVHVPGQGGVSGESSKIDMNRAELDEIMTLEGIGPVSAEKLIAYRRLNRPFRSLDDLLAAGLTRSQVDKIKDDVIFR